MIKKLRIKFIVLSMAAVFVLLAIVVAGMNLFNYRAVIKESENTLEFLAHHQNFFQGGKKPELQEMDEEEDQEDWDEDFRIPEDKRGELPPGMSVETPYESRFFCVLVTTEQVVKQTNISRIASISAEEAGEYALQAMTVSEQTGLVDEYLFLKVDELENTRITFLDCGRKLASFRTFLIISLIVAGVGYILFFFVIYFCSKRIIHPVAESYEKQKRFITDAGHEIKTPLAIIKADADVLEMDLENNEWIEDIQKQSERLTSLTNDLVSLARMEEQSALPKTEIMLSELVEEETDAYQMLAQAEGKKLERKIQPAVVISGEEKSLRRLVNILMDNAMKYSPEASTVSVKLEKSGKQIQMTVLNQTKEAVSKESLSLLFDRFYRTDASRNSETGGHGIGLSMAKAIVEAHDGKIYASSPEDDSLQMNITFPS